MYSKYYQSLVKKDKTWFISGILKSEENLVLSRTIDKQLGLLEYFVSPEQEEKFLKVMDYFIKEGIVSELQEKENRLKTEEV